MKTLIKPQNDEFFDYIMCLMFAVNWEFGHVSDIGHADYIYCYCIMNNVY